MVRKTSTSAASLVSITKCEWEGVSENAEKKILILYLALNYAGD